MNKHLKILLLVIASVSVVSSCGKEDKSEWYVTSDGVGLSLEDRLSIICKRMSLDRMLKKTYAGAYFWNIRDMSESVKTVYDIDIPYREFTSKERNKVRTRLQVWEKHKALFIIAGVVFVLGLGTAVVVVNVKSYNSWPNRKEPYSLTPIYLLFVLGGWFGLHRARLDVTSFWSLLKSQYPLFVLLFFFSLRNIIVCGMNIELWSYMPSWTCITILFWLLVFWLLVDIVWIRFRVYQLTGMYFRKTQDELDILEGKKTEIETFCETTGQRIEKKLQELPGLIEEADKIYSKKFKTKEKENLIDKAMKAVARDGSLEFEEEKLNDLMTVCSKSEKVVTSVRWYYDRMFAYLRDSRLAAYRNLYLAKELMAVARSVQGKKQELQTDIYHEMDMDITLDASVLAPVTFNYESMLGTFSDTAKMFSRLGFKNGTSMAIGAGMAIADAVINNVSARNEKKMEIVKNQAKVIDALKKISGDLSKIQAEILKSLEILASLYKCNKAFVNAYVPLRDEVFGDATFTNFIRGVRSDNPLFSSEEFIKDVNHLCAVCSEYNKINKAK